VKVEFLLARYGLAVAFGWVECPLLNCCNDGLVDAMAQPASDLQIRDLSGGIDDDIYDDIAFRAAGKRGQIRFRCGEEARESYVDVAGTEGVGTDGGVRLRGDGRVSVG
jgi:hypothetical protein